MSHEMQQRVRDLFETAVEKPVAERLTWLREQTGTESAVYEQVARLLQASSASGEFLAQPACRRVLPPMTEGMIIGAYRVLRELGSGGMGIVYLSVRSDQAYHRLAALKVIRPELRSDPLVERFLAEREILARLDHPNIARIIDGGQTAEGLPYFVMDYVDGLPIDIFCSQRSATLTQRLNLFRQICEAVQYLHDNHIVHRDLKPANLLVTQDGVVKLLDFGIARPSDSATSATTGLPLLSPGYASPEQIISRSASPAADIYSLGAVLYELLTGARPLNFDGMGLQQMLKAVAELDPCPPSRVPIPPAPGGVDPNFGAIHSRLAGDLDSIVLMALRKDPSRRYASPAAFATDIERFQQNLPVMARRTSSLYLVGKTLQRHGVRIAASLVVAASLAFGGFSTYQAIHYRHQILQIRNEVETLRSTYLPSNAAAQVLTHVPVQASPSSGSQSVPQLNPQFSKDLNQLTHDLESVAPAVLRSPLAPRRLTSDMVDQSLDLFSRTAPETVKDPASAAALGRAYLAASELQWNPDGTSLNQPAQAAESCKKALQAIQAAKALTGNKLEGNNDVQQVVTQLLSTLHRIPAPE
jgi:serine/threonine protein kinase